MFLCSWHIIGVCVRMCLSYDTPYFIQVWSPCGGKIFQSSFCWWWPCFSGLPVCHPLCDHRYSCAAQAIDAGNRTHILGEQSYFQYHCMQMKTTTTTDLTLSGNTNQIMANYKRHILRTRNSMSSCANLLLGVWLTTFTASQFPLC